MKTRLGRRTRPERLELPGNSWARFRAQHALEDAVAFESKERLGIKMHLKRIPGLERTHLFQLAET